ncbi:hypothetical protein EX30DRAFT_175863 [Ascodesmis nigricans]|uniref:Uncharacterized protein n=1 Tax=Ascodesmis nigricans TaxID=341454 RepID=A0A4S2MRM5_9PEZI|nr:hypothetical protein EX30DRAFT_175863 [Ascodesmis nigricans]
MCTTIQDDTEFSRICDSEQLHITPAHHHDIRSVLLAPLLRLASPSLPYRPPTLENPLHAQPALPPTPSSTYPLSPPLPGSVPFYSPRQSPPFHWPSSSLHNTRAPGHSHAILVIDNTRTRRLMPVHFLLLVFSVFFFVIVFGLGYFVVRLGLQYNTCLLLESTWRKMVRGAVPGGGSLGAN